MSRAAVRGHHEQVVVSAGCLRCHPTAHSGHPLGVECWTLWDTWRWSYCYICRLCAGARAVGGRDYRAPDMGSYVGLSVALGLSWFRCSWSWTGSASGRARMKGSGNDKLALSEVW